MRLKNRRKNSNESKLEKGLLTLGLASGLIVSLAACGSKKDTNESGSAKLPSISKRYKIDKETPAWKIDTKKKQRH